MWILKLLLIGVFLIIFIQDCKDRKVYWFLYPTLGILVFLIQIQFLDLFTTFINSAINLLFVSLLLLICYLYSILKLKKTLLKEVFGLGDLLFFIFIAFSFSTVSFIVLFVFSLLFSLSLHFALQHRQTDKTVPLAGYMSLFFGAVFGITFFGDCNFLYAY